MYLELWDVATCGRVPYLLHSCCKENHAGSVQNRASLASWLSSQIPEAGSGTARLSLPGVWTSCGFEQCRSPSPNRTSAALQGRGINRFELVCCAFLGLSPQKTEAAGTNRLAWPIFSERLSRGRACQGSQTYFMVIAWLWLSKETDCSGFFRCRSSSEITLSTNLGTTCLRTMLSPPPVDASTV